MRKEIILPGNFVHVYNRGNRKTPIFREENDYWRFLKMLFYFNDNYAPQNIIRGADFMARAGECDNFTWPKSWPKRDPIVRIIAYCLIPNHFHLLLQEIIAGGISNFMHRLGTAHTNYFNLKYKEAGRLFQGPYKRKIIEDIGYLQYVDCYVQVFNSFELFKGGVEASLKNFKQAFEAAIDYPFSSLGESFGVRKMGIIEREELQKIFPSIGIYKKFAEDALISRITRSYLGKLAID